MTGLLYLGALKTCAEIAEKLGEGENAREYLKIFENGRKLLAEELFNGEYLIQKYDRGKDYKYQYGDGCLSDQLLGQWLADTIGLGDLIPGEYIEKTLESIFKYNWKDDLSEHSNCQRTYALNDEKGLLLCTWPKGNREKFPFPYSDEVWTGIEYQVASHLIYRGFLREGLTMVRGLRERFDGLKRNPWDEPECGHHYARAMSSWALLLALSGYQYDGRISFIGFSPKLSMSRFRSFFSTTTGWGIFSQDITKDSCKFNISSSYGNIKIRLIKLDIPERFSSEFSVKLITGNGDREVDFKFQQGIIELENTIELKEGEVLEVSFS